jgi:tetratricopeptide (TPR) repeat protein
VITLRWVTVLTLGAVTSAPAQLAITQPTEKLLILPLAVTTPADSATSIAVMDIARDRLIALARYKVLTVPKNKICEALTQSGFQCDILLSEQQAAQLARSLSINSFTVGSLSHSATLTAKIRVTDGSSGFGMIFTAQGSAPPILGEAIAQRLASIVRAAESARECRDQRSRGATQRALEAARKALTTEPNLPAAHLCVESVYELQRFSPDSMIAACRRALAGDSLNATAWNCVAQNYLSKGDTVRAMDAFYSLALTDLKNTGTVRGTGQLLLTNRQYQKCVQLIQAALQGALGDATLLDLGIRCASEGQLWRAASDFYQARLEADTTLGHDSTFLKGAIAVNQAIPDTTRLLGVSRVGVRSFPRSRSFVKQLAAAYELAGKSDSAILQYQRALQMDTTDVATSLLIAKAMVDRLVFDTARAGDCRRRTDTTCLKAMGAAFADRVDSARPYLQPGAASPDSGVRINAAVILLQGGSKLAQAQAYDRAYPWLDQLLNLVAPRSPADTLGPRQAIRVQAGFWFGLASTLSLGPRYSDMIKSKNCERAKEMNDRIERTKSAMQVGARVSPNLAQQMLGILAKYTQNIAAVKRSFRCRNF